ncbi:MAG: DUF1849 family protein [Pseudomonadota bacterium]
MKPILRLCLTCLLLTFVSHNIGKIYAQSQSFDDAHDLQKIFERYGRSHEAVYQLSVLLNDDLSSENAYQTGLMIIRVVRACHSWQASTYVSFEPLENGHLNEKSSIYEWDQKGAFTFKHSERNEGQDESILVEGYVSAMNDQSNIVIAFEKPSQFSFEVPASTLNPFSDLSLKMKQIKHQKTHVTYHLFDGLQPVRLQGSSFLLNQTVPIPEGFESFFEEKHLYQFSNHYFSEKSNEDQEALFSEQSIMGQNGITTWFQYDMTDHKLDFKLTKLRLLDPKPC